MCAQRRNRTSTTVLLVVAMGAFLVAGVLRVQGNPAHTQAVYQNALLEGVTMGIVGMALLVGVIRLIQTLLARPQVKGRSA